MGHHTMAEATVAQADLQRRQHVVGGGFPASGADEAAGGETVEPAHVDKFIEMGQLAAPSVVVKG